jgi:hypothetical protein
VVGLLPTPYSIALILWPKSFNNDEKVLLPSPIVTPELIETASPLILIFHLLLSSVS